MIEYAIRENWRQYVHKKIKSASINDRTVVRHYRSQETGFLGECAFGRYLQDNNIDFEYHGDCSFDFDFIVNGIYIDVKSSGTKYGKKPEHNCILTQYQEKQRTDIYVFTAVSQSKVWLMGWEDKKRFWQNGERKSKGEISGNLAIKQDCILMQYKQLAPMQDLLTYLALHEDPPL